MERNVREAMSEIVDRYVHVPDLLELLHACVQEKENEKSVWAKLTISVHRMLDGTFEGITRVGAVTELILLALDIADDIQDNDNLDKPWMSCPKEYAVNAILALFAAAMAETAMLQGSYAASGGTNPAAARLSGEIGVLLAQAVNGQQLDLNGTIATEEDCVASVMGKSGSLIRLALRMGYAFAPPQDEAVAARIDALADQMGMMAQLRNDLRDILRYDVKNDLLQKKKTLPILFLLSDTESPFRVVRDYYEGSLSRDEFLRHKIECIRYIEDSGCVEYVNTIRYLYFYEAERLFGEIPGVSPGKEQFYEIALAPHGAS